MYAYLSHFEKKITIQKGPLFPNFKRSPSIHKNNPALVVSIVLEKIYFHGICALFKKQSISRVLVRSLKKPIVRVKNVKNQNLTHPKAAKLATLSMAPFFQKQFNICPHE